jgi:hypothetical protein
MLSCNMLFVAWLQKWMNKEPAFQVSALWGRRNTKWCIQSLWLLLPNIVFRRARVCYEFLGFNPTAWTATVFSVVGMRRWGSHFPPALSTPSIAQKNTSVSMVTICHGNQTSRSRWPLPSLSQLTADLPGPSNFFSDFVPGYASGYDITTRWAHRFGHTGFVFRPRPPHNEPLNRGSRNGFSRARARPGMWPWSRGGGEGDDETTRLGSACAL